MTPTLELQGFGVAFGNKPILTNITLSTAPTGVMVLLGPGGAGKSTLLETLAGLNDTHPSLHTSGRAYLEGRPIRTGHRPKLVPQRQSASLQSERLSRSSPRTVLASLLEDDPLRGALALPEQTERAEQLLADGGWTNLIPSLEKRETELSPPHVRILAILRATASDPSCLFLDEVDTGLDAAGAEVVLAEVCRQAERRSVVIVTHHQGRAKNLGGQTVLLARGRVIEAQPTRHFFASPRTQPAQDFVRTGSCSVYAASAHAEDLAPSVQFPGAARHPSAGARPKHKRPSRSS